MKKLIYFKIILLLSVASTAYFRLYKSLISSKEFFLDSMVYYCGPLLFHQTGNGYNSLLSCSSELVNFKFVYLPIYLRILKFYVLTPDNFYLLWIVSITSSTFIVLLVLKRIYNYKNIALVGLISLLGFSAIPLQGYLSGNISSILYVPTAIGLMIIFFENKKLRLFGLLLITLPSLFKIHMIIFLLVPFLLFEYRHLRILFLLVALPFTFILLNKYMYPEEFNFLYDNIAILPYVGDMGVGSLQSINYIKSSILNIGISFNPGRHNWLADLGQINKKDFLIDYLAYGVLFCVIIFRIYKIRSIKLSSDLCSDKKLKFSIALIGSYLLIPRLKQYDMILCTLPLLYIVNSDYFQIILANLRLIIKPQYLIIIFNILILGFYNIKGDNYFIYPIILLIFALSTYHLNKIENDSQKS